MKKIVLLAFLITSAQFLEAQQNTPATKLAQIIAVRMADSLGLNNKQREKIVEINLELSGRKAAFYRSSDNRENVEKLLQGVERTRDRKYEKVLTKKQYTIYLQRKGDLVRAS